MDEDGEQKDASDEQAVAAELRRRACSSEGSVEELMEGLYGELRRMADAAMRGERGSHTLQPTALVHEAFLRLADAELTGEQGRLSFLAAASQVMRRVLVDHARRRGAEKRGGRQGRVTLSGVESASAEDEVDVLEIHAALERLSTLDARQARIVELRFFAGMTGAEIAEHLDVSRNTVVRELTLARAWLATAMGRD